MYNGYVQSLVHALTKLPAVEYADRPYGRNNQMTMQPAPALRRLSTLVERIVDSGLDGDVHETGTWRGACGIFMVAVFHAYECYRGAVAPLPRHFYLWDSFAGFTSAQVNDSTLFHKPGMRFETRLGSSNLCEKKGRQAALDAPHWVASLDRVMSSFRRYGVLHARVHFIKGFFEETIVAFGRPARPISLLRLDGDLYSSTIVALNGLYPAV